MLYGQWLNRSTRVKPVLLTHKPLTNFVEAPITWKTSVGLAVPTQNGSPQGVSLGTDPAYRLFSFLPIPYKGMGIQKGRLVIYVRDPVGRGASASERASL